MPLESSRTIAPDSVLRIWTPSGILSAAYAYPASSRISADANNFTFRMSIFSLDVPVFRLRESKKVERGQLHPSLIPLGRKHTPPTHSRQAHLCGGPATTVSVPT